MKTCLVRFALLGLAGAALTVHAQTFDLNKLFDVGKDLVAATGMSEERELEVGREVAGRLLGAAPLVNDPAVQQYVNRVGRWIAVQSERPDLPWRFGVIEASAINAFAAPGGTVLVTRGLYEMLDTESELAAVLAHEMGHILRRHHVRVMQKSAALSAGARLAQREDRSAVLNNLIGSGAEVFARGLDKSAEFEADRIAVVLAARAGYSPYGLVSVLHKLDALGADDGALALMFKTHPPPGERLAALATVLEPRVATLPVGAEPPIRRVAATTGAPPVAAQGASAAAPAPAPTQEGAAESPGDALPGIDPGKLLRGLFGH